MRFKVGSSRACILIFGYCVKLPISKNGIKDNTLEYKTPASSFINKTLFSLFGLVNIQKEAKPVRHEGLFHVDLTTNLLGSLDWEKELLLRDPKYSNFGYYSGKLLLLDYGATR